MRSMVWKAIAVGLAGYSAGCSGSPPALEQSPPPPASVTPTTTTPPPSVSATAPPTPTGSSANPTATSSAAAAQEPAKLSKIDLMGIWGSDATHIWVVGEKGTILRGDGATWVQVASGTTAKLRSVTGTDANHAWAAGEHTILAWDGTGWHVAKQDVPDQLVAILAIDPSHVFTVGRGGSIWMWDGATWTMQRPPKGGELLSIAGEDLKHLYAVGEDALLLQFDGKKTWRKLKSPPSYRPDVRNDGSYTDRDEHAFFTRAYVRGGHMFVSNSAGYVMEGRPGGAWSISLHGNPSAEWGIYGFWGTDAGRMWFVTDEFIAWRETKGPWKSCRSPLFYSVWGTDERNVWAVGSGGLIVKLDGRVLIEGENCKLPEGGKWAYRAP